MNANLNANVLLNYLRFPIILHLYKPIALSL